MSYKSLFEVTECIISCIIGFVNPPIIGRSVRQNFTALDKPVFIKILYIVVMKRTTQLFIALFTGLVIFLQAKAVNAAASDFCAPGFERLCDLKIEGAGGSTLVGKIVTLLLIIAVVLALIYLVYGGIKYITSGGDKAKVDAARSHITAAIVGLIMALLAYFILNIIAYLFLGVSITTFTIPTLVP